VKKDKIYVFLFDEMTDYEITFLVHLLGTDGDKEIVPIAYENKRIRSRSGFLYQPVDTVSNAVNNEAEGLILCGGWYGETKGELLQLIKQLSDKKKLVAGICGAGTVFLAKAGVLNGRNYTTPAVEWTPHHIQVFGETNPFPRDGYLEQRVVRDENIITAKGEAFLDFTVEICDWFQMFEDQEEKNQFISNVFGYERKDNKV
jgi:putative intracellular protease/amidase